MSTGSAALGAELFAALSDGSRLAIVERLAVSPLSVGEIAEALSASYAAVSQHLKVLRTAGLVSRHRSGRHSIYRLETAALEKLSAYISMLRDNVSLKAVTEPDQDYRMAEKRAFEQGMRARWGCWPEIDPVVAAISAWIRYTSQILETMKDEVGAEFGASARDSDLLGVLYRIGAPHESTPTELARISLLSLPRMTRRLDHLEQLGLISRTADASDRRSRIVRLTPRGADVVNAVMNRHLSNCERYLLAGISPGERYLLAYSLWRVGTAIRGGGEQPAGQSGATGSGSRTPKPG